MFLDSYTGQEITQRQRKVHPDGQPKKTFEKVRIVLKRAGNTNIGNFTECFLS